MKSFRIFFVLILSLSIHVRSNANHEAFISKVAIIDIKYLLENSFAVKELKKALKVYNNKAAAAFELKENLNNPEFHRVHINDDKKKCIRAIDSAILHYKMQNALKQAKIEFAGKSGFDRKTLADHKEYFDNLKLNIANALRIITSPNSSRETRISAQKMIEHNQNEMISLENSPLLAFKRRFDEILTEEKHVVRLGQFEELKSLIESGAIPANLEQLRNYLIEIDEGIFGFVPDPEEL